LKTQQGLLSMLNYIVEGGISLCVGKASRSFVTVYKRDLGTYSARELDHAFQIGRLGMVAVNRNQYLSNSKRDLSLLGHEPVDLSMWNRDAATQSTIRQKGHFFGGWKNKWRHNLRRSSDARECMTVTIAGRIERTFHAEPFCLFSDSVAADKSLRNISFGISQDRTLVVETYASIGS
jgi:hypothetical protein